MQYVIKFLMCFVVVLVTTTTSAQSIELAQTSKEKCLHTCIEQYGADKKSACALQCGFGGGHTRGAPTKDCGTVYKQCLQSCGTDKNCKNTCRKQRTNCY